MPTGEDAPLIARNLRRSFRIGSRRIEVLRGISMEVRHGEAVFLVGASGAGKTTLLYTLAGLERPEDGTVEFRGRRLYSGSSRSEAKIRNTEMGFVFQGYFLLPELTALENVMLPGMIGGRVKKSVAEESLRADSKTGDAIIDLLLSLARERNKTLLVVTHDARLAGLGDRQLHIVDGQLE